MLITALANLGAPVSVTAAVSEAEPQPDRLDDLMIAGHQMSSSSTLSFSHLDLLTTAFGLDTAKLVELVIPILIAGLRTAGVPEAALDHIRQASIGAEQLEPLRANISAVLARGHFICADLEFLAHTLNINFITGFLEPLLQAAYRGTRVPSVLTDAKVVGPNDLDELCISATSILRRGYVTHAPCLPFGPFVGEIRFSLVFDPG